MNQYVVVDLEMCKVPYLNRKKNFMEQTKPSK